MPTQVNIRQKRFVEKQKAEGLKRVQIWLKPDEKDLINKLLENIRAGQTIDLSTENNKICEKRFKSSINDQIKSGTFSLLGRKNSPKYLHDFLSDPERFWHNPLPDALLVVADKKQRTKEWRAVSLEGLGAFPVVWSIVYALNRYAYQKIAKTSPRRRSFNLLAFDFETVVKLIVGNAAMHADESLKGTSLGFFTYPLAVSSLLLKKDIENEFPEGILTVVIDESGRLRGTNAFCDNIDEVTAWRITPPILEARIEAKQGWNPYMHALSQLFEI